jgi:hypothetical protein
MYDDLANVTQSVRVQVLTFLTEVLPVSSRLLQEWQEGDFKFT